MMAERRRRVDAGKRREFADFLSELPIALDTDTAIRLWGETQNLAERFHLTVYDAVCLELAQRKRLPLASLDADLRQAAVALGVTVLGRDPA